MRRFRKYLWLSLCLLFGVFLIGCSRLNLAYRIEFVVDGETYAVVGTDAQRIAMPDEPTKKNYVFDGWYWDEGEWSEPFTLASILEQPIRNENEFRVYARWQGETHTVTLLYEDMAPAEVRYGGAYVLPVPSRPGYVFDGWYCTDGNGEKIFLTDGQGDSLENWTREGGLGVLPEWKPGEYSILFTSEYGDGQYNRVQKAVYLSAVGTLPQPRYEYAEFQGWFTRDGQQITSDTLYTFTSDIQVFAKWKGIELTLHFDSNGGETVPDQTVRYGESCGKLPVPTKYGYVFSGWYYSEPIFTSIDEDTVVDWTTDITLSASWDVKSVDITFDFNFPDLLFEDPSSLPGTTVLTYRYDGYVEDSEVPWYHCVGYDFIAWFTADGREFYPYGRCPFAEDTTVYAHWERRVIKIIPETGGKIYPSLPSFQVLYGEKLTELPVNLVRPGWIARRWKLPGFYPDVYVDRDFVVEIDGYELTLYPAWEEYYLNAEDGSLQYVQLPEGADEDLFPKYDFSLGLVCSKHENSIAVTDINGTSPSATLTPGGEIVDFDVFKGNLAVACSDGKVKLYNLNTLAHTRTLDAPSVTAVALAGDNLIVNAASDLFFYRVADCSAVAEVEDIGSGAFVTDGDRTAVYFLSRKADLTIHLHSYTPDGKLLQSVRRSDASFDAAFRSVGDYVAIGWDYIDADTLQNGFHMSYLDERYAKDDSDSLSNKGVLYFTGRYTFVYAVHTVKSSYSSYYLYGVIRIFDEEKGEYIDEFIINNLMFYSNASPSFYYGVRRQGNLLFFTNGSYAGVFDLNSLPAENT